MLIQYFNKNYAIHFNVTILLRKKSNQIMTTFKEVVERPYAVHKQNYRLALIESRHRFGYVRKCTLI